MARCSGFRGDSLGPKKMQAGAVENSTVLTFEIPTSLASAAVDWAVDWAVT